MDDKRRINVNVDHSEPVFFTDNVTVWHNPQKFVMDFTNATPRFDKVGEENQQTIAVKHKTLIMDPILAKIFLGVLKDNIEKYEKNINKIAMPKPSKLKPVKPARLADAASKYIG